MSAFCNQALSLSAVEPAVTFLIKPLEPVYGPAITEELSRALSTALLPYHMTADDKRVELLVDNLGCMRLSLGATGDSYVLWPRPGDMRPAAPHRDSPQIDTKIGAKLKESTRARLLLRSLVLQAADDISRTKDEHIDEQLPRALWNIQSALPQSNGSTMTDGTSELPYAFPTPPPLVPRVKTATHSFSDHTSARHFPPFAPGPHNHLATPVAPSRQTRGMAAFSPPEAVTEAWPRPTYRAVEVPSRTATPALSVASSASSTYSSPRTPRSSSLPENRYAHPNFVAKGPSPHHPMLSVDTRRSMPSPRPHQRPGPPSKDPRVVAPPPAMTRGSSMTAHLMPHQPRSLRRERTFDGIWWCDGVPGGSSAPRSPTPPIPAHPCRPNTAPQGGETYLYQGGRTNVLSGGVTLGVARAASVN